MTKILLTNAILWASTILLASYFFSDHESYTSFFGFLIVAAGFQNAYLYSSLKKNQHA